MACEHLDREPDSLVYTAERCRLVDGIVRLICDWLKDLHTRRVQTAVNLDRCPLDAKVH